jgi:hypothetical protein
VSVQPRDLELKVREPQRADVEMVALVLHVGREEDACTRAAERLERSLQRDAPDNHMVEEHERWSPLDGCEQPTPRLTPCSAAQVEAGIGARESAREIGQRGRALGECARNRKTAVFPEPIGPNSSTVCPSESARSSV